MNSLNQQLTGDEVDIERQSLMTSTPKADDGPVEKLVMMVEQRTSVKKLVRVWGPRLEVVVRLMLVATFLDDSLRTVMHFSELSKQVGEQGILNRFAETSPGFVAFASAISLGVGLLVQSIGSFCLLALVQADIATMVLIVWATAQPILFGQVSSLEFVAESLTLVGGLLLLRAHVVCHQENDSSRTQLYGRLLLPAAYVYYAGHFLFSSFDLHETQNFVQYGVELSMFVITIVFLVGLAVASALVAAGLRSRIVALVLALVNLGFVFYQHPFFLFLYFEGGEWKVNTDRMWYPGVAELSDVAMRDFDPWQIFDLHRYYFFLGLSTSGALLLLSQFGPGEIAVQEDEKILPVVAKAQD